MAKKPDYKAAYQARNERAKAEGYKSYNDKRVKEGQARGLTKSQARGHAKKGEKSAKEIKQEKKKRIGGEGVPKRPKQPGIIHIEGVQHEKLGDRPRMLDIQATGEQMEVYERLLEKGKTEAARVYALDEVYDAPGMAGIQWNDDMEFNDEWIEEITDGDTDFLSGN